MKIITHFFYVVYNDGIAKCVYFACTCTVTYLKWKNDLRMSLCGAFMDMHIHFLTFNFIPLTFEFVLFQEEIDMELGGVSSDDNTSSKEPPKKELQEPKQSINTLLQRQAKFLEGCREVKVSYSSNYEIKVKVSFK